MNKDNKEQIKVKYILQ